MNTNNIILENMPAVISRAAQLNCTVVAVLKDYILCHRGDGTYITWKCSIQMTKADFHWGDYDMLNFTVAHNNLMLRAGV